jgi:hypothetical protein
VRDDDRVPARRRDDVTVPHEQDRREEDRDSVICFMRCYQVTGCFKDWSFVAESLSQPRDKGHVLAGRPDVPRTEPHQNRLRSEKSQQMLRECDLLTRIDRGVDPHRVETIGIRIGQGSAVTLMQNRRKRALSTPRDAF